jgi:thioredoxin 1
MSTVELTTENFDEVVSGNDFVVIDFWADWCGPCRQFAPVYARAAEKNEDLVFATVDTEVQQKLAAAFQVRSIPTLAVIRDQTVIYAQPGALPDAALESLLKQAREVDMDEVRKQAAEATPES